MASRCLSILNDLRTSISTLGKGVATATLIPVLLFAPPPLLVLSLLGSSEGWNKFQTYPVLKNVSVCSVNTSGLRTWAVSRDSNRFISRPGKQSERNTYGPIETFPHLPWLLHPSQMMGRQQDVSLQAPHPEVPVNHGPPEWRLSHPYCLHYDTALLLSISSRNLFSLHSFDEYLHY